MAIEIYQANFELIGQLASHCDKEKLEIATQEALLFDIEPLLCEMYVDIDDNWNSQDAIWKDLIDGSTYEGCGGRDVRNLGVKRMILYYIYARYIVLNNFNDTPNGHVTKTNQFSLPKPLKELEQFSDKYRSMGYAVWENVKKFVCHNRDDYDFKVECEPCGCDGNGCGGTKAKGYGIKMKNISKWDV